MAKLGLLLILLGVGSLVLRLLGFKLSFEDFMGTAWWWICLLAAAFGTLLLYAGGRSGT